LALRTTLVAVDARIVFDAPMVRGPDEARQMAALFECLQAK
jgi:hypothetical protein